MIYLDTEFDSFKGELISIAMVSSITKQELYVIVKDHKCNHPWVKENVIPKLYAVLPSVSKWGIDVVIACDEEELKQAVQKYLIYHTGETVLADWPEDFKHLLDQLYWAEGRQLNINLTFKLLQSGKCKSKVPHNALSDARALMEWHRDYLSVPA